MTETIQNTLSSTINFNEDSSNKHISIFAIGGAGCQILNKLAKQTLPEQVNLLAIDTDTASLKEKNLVVENSIKLNLSSYENGRSRYYNTEK